MLFSFFSDRKNARNRPLAHAADSSPGTLHVGNDGEPVPVVILSSSATGVKARAAKPIAVGEQVTGEYRVRDVAFAFQGEVVGAAANQVNFWDVDIRFVTVPL